MITKDEELEKILKKYNYVGLNILHTDKEKIDYLISSGYQDIDTKKGINDQTVYRIASISKVEIALGIMKLYEMGLVSFYDDVSKYLGFKLRNPKFPDKIITLEMIMTQTSSISDCGDEVRHVGYDGINGYISDNVPLEDLLNNPSYCYYTPGSFSDYEPGTVWEYSNFGCGILACIIEKLTHKNYDEFLREEIFDKLGLDASYYVTNIKNQENIASLYEYDNKSDSFILERNKEMFIEKVFPKYPLGNNFRGPAGGLFITAKDLSIIMMMLMNDGTYDGKTLFKKETIEEMKKVHWQGWAYDPEYRKKGLQLLELYGLSKETLMGHCGNAYGLRSFMLFNEHHGYIFLCNGANYGLYQDHFVEMMSDILKFLIAKFE